MHYQNPQSLAVNTGHIAVLQADIMVQAGLERHVLAGWASVWEPPEVSKWLQ